MRRLAGNLTFLFIGSFDAFGSPIVSITTIAFLRWQYFIFNYMTILKQILLVFLLLDQILALLEFSEPLIIIKRVLDL